MNLLSLLYTSQCTFSVTARKVFGLWNTIGVSGNSFQAERSYHCRQLCQTCAKSCYKTGWLTPLGSWKLSDRPLTKGTKTADPPPFWSDLPSTLIRHENGAFRKRSPNRRNLKTPALFTCYNLVQLVWTENILKRSFSKRLTLQKSRDFSCRVFLKHNLVQIDRWLLRQSNFSGVVWTKTKKTIDACVFRVLLRFK